MSSWSVLFAVGCAVTALAALHDARTGIIPNRLTLAVFVLAVPLHVLTRVLGEGLVVWAALLSAVLGAALSALVPLLLFRLRALGGGDVKLFVALGALLGVRFGLEVELFSFALGALVSPLWLLAQGKLRASVRRSLRILSKHRIGSDGAGEAERALTEMRFGPVIFGATLLLTIWSSGAPT